MDHRVSILIVGLMIAVSIPGAPLTAADVTFFERKIRPLLAEHCYECHSEETKTVHGGIRLDSAAGIRQGGDSGPAVVAGKPDQSLLLQVMHYDGDIQMPPQGKLSEQEIRWMRRWIAAGAALPESDGEVIQRDGGIDFAAARTFWAFQPVTKQPLPKVSDPAWPRQRLDAFILAALDREGLSPSPSADRVTLLRRLTFALVGLPPTPEQTRAFLADDSPHAVEHLVDRLLESPRYGEHWGRWWLDLARYTDRTASWLYQGSNAHLYRDWVVAALNQDLPYDVFVKRQLATDLMPETGPEDLPALGFLSLSPTYWKELKLPCEIIKTIVADEWEERVDAVSRTFLGLTVACARCHDHKFDPISSEDYYALAGVFASSRQIERPMIPEADYAPARRAKAEVAKLEGEITKLKKNKPVPEDEINKLTEQIKQLKAGTPHYDAPLASAISEESLYVVRAGKTPQDGTRLEYRDEPRDLPLFIRGNPNRPGPVVPRRFLTVLSETPEPYQRGSGRLELAESIVQEARSLAARVVVNRVWLAHFGRGIVRTPSNFGQQGERPTHPELLDDLTARFIAGGWSLKKLHREIVLSATWQQSSAADPKQLAADPDNRWLGRMQPRRLNYEQWRDAMLACSGDLENAIGGVSQALDDPDNRRRTLYATVHRRDMSPTMLIHDVPNPTQHSPERATTVTALQGLYALNGPLLLQQSARIADRVIREAGGGAEAQVEQLYQTLYSRSPTGRELEIGRQFLRAGTAEGGEGKRAAERLRRYAHALLASNEFMFLQ